MMNDDKTGRSGGGRTCGADAPVDVGGRAAPANAVLDAFTANRLAAALDAISAPSGKF